MTKAVHPTEEDSSEPAGFYWRLDKTTHQNKSQKEVRKYNGAAQLPADRSFPLLWQYGNIYQKNSSYRLPPGGLR